MSKKVRLPFQPSDHGPGPHYSQAPKQEIVFHALIMTAAVVIVLAGMKAASGIIAPMLLALFATIILLVPLRWLKSKGCPSLLSLVIVLGCVAILFLGLTRLVVSSLSDLSKDSQKYAQRIEREFHRVENTLEQMGFKLNYGGEKKQEKAEENSETSSEETLKQAGPMGRPSGETLPKSEQNNLQTEVQSVESPSIEALPLGPSSAGAFLPPSNGQITDSEGTTNPAVETTKNGSKKVDKTLLSQARSTWVSLIPEPGDDETDLVSEEEPEQSPSVPMPVEPSLIDLNAQSLTSWFTQTVSEVRHLVEKGFLVMIITLFMIFEASRFPVKIDRAFGKGPITNEHFHKIANEIRRYLFLKAISSILSGGAATMIYLFFGVPAALFWGLVAFFLYFIPNIGGILASIIPGLLIFMEGGLPAVLIYVVCLIAVECTIGYGLEPKILGHGLGISTVVIILSLITWGWLLGAIGLFLAAPLTIMVKIILQAFKETEWIAILIGDGSKRSQE